MRQIFRLLTLFFLIHLNSYAQPDIRQDTRVDTLLKQVAAKRPGLIMFGRKYGQGGYVNMAVLADGNRTLTWFNCYGQAFDVVRLTDDVYNKIKSGSLDPFNYYKDYVFNLLSHIRSASAQFRERGQPALNDTANIYRRVYTSPLVQQAGSTLQKEVAMEKLMGSLCLRRSLFDSRTPRQLMPSDSFQHRFRMAGRISSKGDTTTYYNTNPLSSAARIVLYKQAPGKMFVYDRQGELADSVPLKEGKYANLLKEKEDVFLLYRGWLELQCQQALSAKEEVTALINREHTMLYKPAYWKQHKQQLQQTLLEIQEQVDATGDKVMGFFVPSPEDAAHLLATVYEDKPAEISYLPGLGFAYTLGYNRGDKRYELTDHRENMMVAVSDRKKAIDENNDGVIEYYHSDVVNAGDYYPFGMLAPERTYSAASNYRYGFNGKENDNEIKGEGNQQDYGMRIYDPRIAKFLSIDPLTPKYPELTPYQFASNTPIMGVDLDGKEIYVTIGSVARKGTDIKVTGAVDIKYKVLNLSQKEYTPERFSADQSVLQERFSRMFTGQGTYIYGDAYRSNGQPVATMSEIKKYNITGDIKVNFSMELINNISQINKGDYVFLIVDDLNSKNAEDEVGHGDNSGNVAAVEASSFIEQFSLKYKMVMLHEMGHNLGLTHTKDAKNFMYSYVADKATGSDASQIGDLLGGVGINNKVKVGKYQYSKGFDTRLRVLEFIKEHNVKISRQNALKTSPNKPTMNVDIKKQ
ncbi:MAG TPA: RHS repeat-associated core domain-containing protein [Chitinophaga sp.]